MHLVVLAERKSSHCCRGIMILIGLIDGTRFNFFVFFTLSQEFFASFFSKI